MPAHGHGARVRTALPRREAVELANDFEKGLYDDKENLQYINIVMRDFVTCEKSALTIRLNFAKGYASADSEFAAEINAFAGVE